MNILLCDFPDTNINGIKQLVKSWELIQEYGDVEYAKFCVANWEVNLAKKRYSRTYRPHVRHKMKRIKKAIVTVAIFQLDKGKI